MGIYRKGSVMGSKPTPGPWEWSENKWRGGWSGIDGADGEVLRPLHCNDGDTGDAWFEPGESISEADARLIAAAPDLLAACKAAWNEIDQTYDGTSPPQITVEIWNQIESAIKKAEGKK